MQPDLCAAGGGLKWDIAVATRVVAEVAAEVTPRDLEPALLESVLADLLRDAGVMPPAHGQFALLTAHMEEADWERLAVIIGMLAREELRGALASQTLPVLDQVERGMLVPARALTAVDLRVLSRSAVRAEELARRVAAGLGIGVNGETSDESDARRVQIDSRRLLANVAVARARAEEWMSERAGRRREPRLGDTYPPGAALKKKLQRLWQDTLPVKGAGSSPPRPHRALPGERCGDLPGLPGEGPSSAHRLISEARAWAHEQVAELLRHQEEQDQGIGRFRGSR
jgi:hypothetical protein